MIRILCYGDSNTWGSAAFGGRYNAEKQWPNILQVKLGKGYKVIQEGLCGRIAGNHDKKDVHRNGRIGYEIALRSACPVDYIVIALGSNDLKQKYGLNGEKIFSDLMWYKKRAQEYAKTDEDMASIQSMLYVQIANYRASKNFNPDPELAQTVNKLLKNSGEPIIELDNLEHSEDGLHYSERDHQKVAGKVYDKLKELENEI